MEADVVIKPQVTTTGHSESRSAKTMKCFPDVLKKSADTGSEGLVRFSSHNRGVLLLAGLHDLARFAGAGRVDDVSIDAGPVHSLPRMALGGLFSTVTVM